MIDPKVCPFPPFPLSPPVTKKGVEDGNSPLKILLLLVGSKGLSAHPAAVVEILSLVSRVSLEILVRRRDLIVIFTLSRLGSEQCIGLCMKTSGRVLYDNVLFLGSDFCIIKYK